MNDSPNLLALRAALMDVDEAANEGLTQIELIARLALSRMECPDAYRRLDWLATALDAIVARAGDTQNTINCMVERLGCCAVNQAQHRRRAAESAARAAFGRRA